jgi:hypothetical protein
MRPRLRGADSARVVHETPSRTEGAGNAGCAARTRSLACEMLEAHERSHHRYTAINRHSPRNGFNGLSRALPGDEFVFVTVVSGLRFCQARSGSRNLRWLGTSNGCQDHTVLPYARASFVSRAVGCSRETRRPATTIARLTLPRPSHPAPNVRDDRDTPLSRGRDSAEGWC